MVAAPHIAYTAVDVGEAQVSHFGIFFLLLLQLTQHSTDCAGGAQTPS